MLLSNKLNLTIYDNIVLLLCVFHSPEIVLKYQTSQSHSVGFSYNEGEYFLL